MNELRRIAVLAPCEGLADFPTYYRGTDADQLLAAWAVAWSPRLIAATGTTPEILCSYQLPFTSGDDADEALQQLDGGLILVPAPAIEQEVRLWIDEVRELLGERVTLLDSFADRADVISELRESLLHPLAEATDYDDELAALGYAWLQVEVLTSSYDAPDWLDRQVFRNHTVDAAKAAVAGDADALDSSLRAAYDHLETLRNHTFPIETWLLDTVLVAGTTLGDRLRKELSETTPKTFRLSKPLADEIGKSTELTNELKQAVVDGRGAIAIGDPLPDDAHVAWSLLPPESMADELDATIDAIQSLSGAVPVVAAPWSAALPPRLTQALVQRGCAGVLLAGFDNGALPYSDQSKIKVTTPEGVALPAIAHRPLDLAAPETFLRWGERLTETLQHDEVATLPLAGWAGCRHPMLDLLRCVARRSPVLGTFVTAENYFANTPPPDRDGTPETAHWGPSSKTCQSPGAAVPLESDQHLVRGLATIAGGNGEGDLAEQLAQTLGGSASSGDEPTEAIDVNAWSFARSQTPGCGFAVAKAALPGQTQISEQALANQHAKLEVDTASGGVRALHVPGVRGPFLSQRLAVGHARDKRGWIAMHVDSPPSASQRDASISTAGELRDRRGGKLAKYRQTVTLAAGAQEFLSRVELEPLDRDTAAHRWFAFRLMLKDSAWQASRGVQWQRLPDLAVDSVATDYYELTNGSQRLAINADTPLRVRRHGERMVDVVLAGGLSEPVAMDLAVTFGSERPLTAAIARRTPMLKVFRPTDAAGPDAGWWLHVDTPSVLVSRITPLAPGDANGRARIHLIETDGRPVTTNLRLWQPLRSAQLIDADQPACPIDPSGAAQVPLAGHGWLRVEVSW